MTPAPAYEGEPQRMEIDMEFAPLETNVEVQVGDEVGLRPRNGTDVWCHVDSEHARLLHVTPLDPADSAIRVCGAGAVLEVRKPPEVAVYVVSDAAGSLRICSSMEESWGPVRVAREVSRHPLIGWAPYTHVVSARTPAPGTGTMPPGDGTSTWLVGPRSAPYEVRHLLQRDGSLYDGRESPVFVRLPVDDDDTRRLLTEGMIAVPQIPIDELVLMTQEDVHRLMVELGQPVDMTRPDYAAHFASALAELDRRLDAEEEQ